MFEMIPPPTSDSGELYAYSVLEKGEAPLKRAGNFLFVFRYMDGRYAIIYADEAEDIRDAVAGLWDRAQDEYKASNVCVCRRSIFMHREAEHRRDEVKDLVRWNDPPMNRAYPPRWS